MIKDEKLIYINISNIDEHEANTLMLSLVSKYKILDYLNKTLELVKRDVFKTNSYFYYSCELFEHSNPPRMQFLTLYKTNDLLSGSQTRRISRFGIEGYFKDTDFEEIKACLLLADCCLPMIMYVPMICGPSMKTSKFDNMFSISYLGETNHLIYMVDNLPSIKCALPNKKMLLK